MKKTKVINTAMGTMQAHDWSKSLADIGKEPLSIKHMSQIGGMYHDIHDPRYAKKEITLRDSYAGIAMRALLETTFDTWEDLAIASYGIADAMLKARDKKEN